jgi:murein DD-endopeptidase MepM/ murein hydrolase activator NlpD
MKWNSRKPAEDETTLRFPALLLRSRVLGLALAAAVLCGAASGARQAKPAPIPPPPPASTSENAAKTIAATSIKSVFWQPDALKQGSPALFTVSLDKPARRVTATWVGKTMTFFKTDDAKVWVALAGDDLETKPGSYNLAVTAVLATGRVVKQTKSVDVAATDFKSGTADVPENFVEPDAASKKLIAADNVLKTRAFALVTPKPLWSGSFVKPVDAPATESFGESRILNEERTSTHRGTDYPVKEGSAVVTANSGTVVLAKEMFYEGNCVIVDHGERLFTIYMHLSKMDVKAGDKLRKGGRIGLSGATGRVTGPHMHFGVRWNGAYLDPVALLALTLPKTEAGPATTGPRPGVRKGTKARAR